MEENTGREREGRREREREGGREGGRDIRRNKEEERRGDKGPDKYMHRYINVGRRRTGKAYTESQRRVDLGVDPNKST